MTRDCEGREEAGQGLPSKSLLELLDERSKEETTYSLEEARRLLGLDD